MYFQAESNNVKYEINVSESREGWKVSLKTEGGEWQHHQFSRSDYQYMDDTISFLLKNTSYLLDVTSSGVDYTVYTRGAFRTVKLYNEEKILHESLKGGAALGSSENLISEMPGKIVKIFVKPGQDVKAGDTLLIMEAMKMENEIFSPVDGVVKEIRARDGDTVNTGDVMVIIG